MNGSGARRIRQAPLPVRTIRNRVGPIRSRTGCRPSWAARPCGPGCSSTSSAEPACSERAEYLPRWGRAARASRCALPSRRLRSPVAARPKAEAASTEWPAAHWPDVHPAAARHRGDRPGGADRRPTDRGAGRLPLHAEPAHAGARRASSRPVLHRAESVPHQVEEPGGPRAESPGPACRAATDHPRPEEQASGRAPYHAANRCREGPEHQARPHRVHRG
jgi:hypothetical protein